MVVCRGVDGRQTIDTRAETSSNGNTENAVPVRGGVDTLEECEFGGVGGGRLIQPSDLLDNEVRVADDLTRGIKLLGC